MMGRDWTPIDTQWRYLRFLRRQLSLPLYDLAPLAVAAVPQTFSLPLLCACMEEIGRKGSIATVSQPRVAAQHPEADSFERTPIRWLRLEILLSSRGATRLLSHRGNHT